MTCFDLVGHLHSLSDSSSPIVCTKSYSLNSILLSPIESIEPDPSSHPSVLTAKKRSSSSLIRDSSISKAHPLDSTCIGTDCISISSNSSDAVCYHPCHTLSYLIDSSHLSLLLMLDDGARRWPLQLDTHAFRRLVFEFGSTSNTSSNSFSDWWCHLLISGDVPYIDFDPIVPYQHALVSALRQHRKQSFQQIAQKLQMDEIHQKSQLADWMSVCGMSELYDR